MGARTSRQEEVRSSSNRCNTQYHTSDTANQTSEEQASCFAFSAVSTLRSLAFRCSSTMTSQRNSKAGLGVVQDITDTLASLSTTADFCKFTTLAERALKLLLPDAVDVLLFVLNPETADLEAFTKTGVDSIVLPRKSGIISNVLNGKKRVVVFDVEDDDPVVALLPSTASHSRGGHKVILSPLLDEQDTLTCFIMIVCGSSQDSLKQLDVAEQLILQSYVQMLQRIKYEREFQRLQTFLKFFGSSCETDVGSFCRKLVSYLKPYTKSENCAVLILDHAAGELCNRISIESSSEMRIEVADSIFEEIVKSNTVLNVSDITEDTKYRGDIQRLTDCHVQSLLCVPVVSVSSSEVIAIVCVCNKEPPYKRYSQTDEQDVKFCCENIAAQLENTLEWEKEMVIKRQQEHLLKVAKNLFTHVDDVGVLLNEIMDEARNLTNAERCSLFLWDRETNELIAKVFDGEIPSASERQKPEEVRIPVTQGIVGHVAMTGKLLNIKDAYSHPLFYRGLDEKTGFRTRNILCFPIKDESGVIGVAQLCNKVNGACFTKFDEDLTQAFAIYCGISIFQSLLYKKSVDATSRCRLASELMIYHMKVTTSEVEKLCFTPISSKEELPTDFDKFTCVPRNIAVESMATACLSMFHELGMVERWRIPREVLGSFVLMVKKGYRDPPYHNWAHAFSAAHFCYLLFKNAGVAGRLRDIEMLALFVSCLCHDLDHRGTTNSFQVSSESPLAALYSSEGSVMERHHFAQAMCVLNTEGCNIFKNLAQKDYQEVLDLMRNIILATDIAHHLKILKDIRAMAEGGYSVDREDHHSLLMFLLMTASDLSDQTKTWEATCVTADLIYTEFFSQGDLEKVMGWTPMEMMDRDRACIPKLQIGFLDGIALPVYRLLHQLLPECKCVQSSVELNRELWQRAQEKGQYVYRPHVNGPEKYNQNNNDEPHSPTGNVFT